MINKYIVLILGGLLISQCDLLAEETKEASEKAAKIDERRKQIEGLNTVLDNFSAYGKLLKNKDVSIKDLKKYLDEHKNEFRTIKLEKLIDLDEGKLEKTRKALERTMKDQISKSIKLRKVFLKVKNGRTFYSKVQQVYQNNWQVINSFMQYQNLDKEEFRDAQDKLIKDMQWTIEIADDGSMEYCDELGSINYSVDASGKPEKEQLGKEGITVALGEVTVTGNLKPNVDIGVSVKQLEDEDKKKYKVESGVIVTKVKEDSLADEFGVKKDDIITHINGNEVKTKSAFAKVMKEASEEETVILKIKRSDKTLTIELELTANSE